MSQPVAKRLFARALVLLKFSAVATSQAALNQQELQQIQSFRDRQAATLRSPMSALGMVALDRIREGDTTIGAAPGSTVRLDHAARLLGTVHRSSDNLTFIPGPPTRPALSIGGKSAVTQAVTFDADGTSPKFEQGSVNFVLRHKDGYFLVARDTAEPALLGFHGLRWYAPDARYRVIAQWVPYVNPRTIRMVNRIGQVTDEPSYGVVRFTIAGQQVQLEPVLTRGREQTLFFVFRDATSRTATYQGGRFLNAALPDHGLSLPGKVVLDFNQAHNPLCAFSEHTSCPLPPRQNQLTIAIPAGEQRYEVR